MARARTIMWAVAAVAAVILLPAAALAQTTQVRVIALDGAKREGRLLSLTASEVIFRSDGDEDIVILLSEVTKG